MSDERDDPSEGQDFDYGTRTAGGLTGTLYGPPGRESPFCDVPTEHLDNSAGTDEGEPGQPGVSEWASRLDFERVLAFLEDARQNGAEASVTYSDPADFTLGRLTIAWRERNDEGDE